MEDNVEIIIDSTEGGQLLAEVVEETIEIIGETTDVIVHDAAIAVDDTVLKQTNTLIGWINSLCTLENVFRALSAIFVIFVIWLSYKIIYHAIKKIPKSKMKEQYKIVFFKIAKYTYFVVLVMYVLGLFGIKLTALLGAAGIAGVAIGFAAQTSMSNLISGIFVLTEQVVKIGDTITVGDTSGVVDSMDALSVKIHTFDNQLVRIPNSKIIDSNLINFSYYPVRRFTFPVSISYDTDMAFAVETIKKAPDLCPSVLKEPAPLVWYDGFGDSGINMTLAVYFNRDDLVKIKNEVPIAIKKVFDEAGITIPFNQLDVHMIN